MLRHCVNTPPARPTLLSLSAFPNPFNARTTIAFTLERPGRASLALFDPAGRRIADLIPPQSLSPGSHKVFLNAGDLPSGLYQIRLEAGEMNQTGSVVLVR